MKTRTGKYLRPSLTMLSLLILAVVLSSCGDSKSENMNPRMEDTTVVPRVSVREVELESFTETLLLTGYMKSMDDVVISTEEGGVLREWTVRRGAYVKKGEVIAALNDDILRPQYETARAQFKIAQLTFERQQKVLEEQGISEVQVKTTEFNRDAAKAQMELAMNRLERTRIKSPINGILDDRLVDEGELAPPGSQVARVVNLDRMKVVVNVPESQAAIVTLGTMAEISFSAFPGEIFEGKISFVGSSVVADNRTVQIEILLRNPGQKFKPDMIARVRLTSDGSRKAMLVDEALVQRIDQRTSVLYLENNGRAERREVTVGGRSDDRLRILGGLNEGDRVIVSGFESLYDGLEVEVIAEDNQ